LAEFTVLNLKYSLGERACLLGFFKVIQGFRVLYNNNNYYYYYYYFSGTYRKLLMFAFAIHLMCILLMHKFWLILLHK